MGMMGYKTPNLDSIAKDGALFTDWYGLIVHHTDANREYAYDKDAKSTGKFVSALADAPRRGWIVVDMKKDWAEIFTP